MARRVWKLSSDALMALQIAADARSTQTDYADDQVWELSLGKVGSPALQLSTRFGGRTGLISVVPTWWIDRQPIYEYQAYSSAPHITNFAPGFLLAEAHLSRDLLLQAGYYALDSHAVGVRFTIKNTANAPRKLNLDLVAFAASQGVERKITVLRSGLSSEPALAFGQAGNIDPVLMLETGDATESANKLSTLLMLPAKGAATLRAVVVGLEHRINSRERAIEWLKADWAKPAVSGARAQGAIPDIETGDDDLDALLAFSYQQSLQAFHNATNKLPNASFVVSRQPDSGYRPAAKPGGSLSSSPNLTRGGQHPAVAYLLALAVAPVAPNLAKGILLNYLSVQKADGWIDWSPGLGGESRGVMCLPILARLAWGIWQYTEDNAFLEKAFEPLLKFLQRWLAPDLDVDGDGVPEWQSEAQTAYPFLPIFSRGLPYGQNADIRLIESPDLTAYLLSEAISLREIALTLNHTEDVASLEDIIARLKTGLESLWRVDLNRYAHRDRDSHSTTSSVMLVIDRPANERYVGSTPLENPARLIVEIVGGTSRPNTLSLQIEGINHAGNAVQEHANADSFTWTAGRGTYTSQHAYSQIDSIRCQGIIPIYKYSIHTVDTSQVDITALMPLWAVDIPPAHAESILALLQDPDHFWRKHGTIMFSAHDPHYQQDRIEFAAGVWGFWLTLMGEALIEAGKYAAAAALLRRFIAGMIPVIKREKAFYEGYHAEKHEGIGVRGHIGGILPLHLFLRVIGVRIISKTRVWTGGDYVWDQPVTISHQGVTVRRAAEGTTVTFPSGETVTLPPNADWQLVTPPSQPTAS